MLKLALAALTLGAASAAAASSPSPPLCRVVAVSLSIPFPPLRSVRVSLRPECPPGGHAFIRLKSSYGPTDPLYGWAELTTSHPTLLFRGVLGNWTTEWEAASGKPYTVPELTGPR